MIEKKVKITNPTGLHLRPAKELVTLAKKYTCTITVIFGEKESDAKTLVKMMKMGIVSGCEITVRFAGTDEKDACDAVLHLLKSLTD